MEDKLAKLYEVPLSCGETLLVKTLSPFLRQALLEQAKTEHPEPDPEPYRKPLQNSLDPSLKEEATDNPAYVAERSKALTKQLFAFSEKVIRAGIAVAVKGEDREITIQRYAAQLAEIRAMLPNIPSDDWLATVMCCLVTDANDVALLRETSNELLTQEEIAQAADSFRRKVQRRKRVANPSSSISSGISVGSRQAAQAENSA